MPVQVREAVERDAEALSSLWTELVARPSTDAAPGDAPAVVVEKAVLRYSGDDSGRIVVAEIDGTVVGCGFMSVAVASPLDEGKAVHLSHVQVVPRYARLGVGSALVEATLAWAEQQGIDAVVTSVPPGHREANRFLARLGMAPVASLRGGSVALVRARLPHAPVAARKSGRAGRSVGKVVAARRSQRRARSLGSLADRTVGAAD